MPTNPFRRKRDPLQQLLDVVDGVRADAARTAGDIRDTAAQAADALGEAAPEGTSKRLPLIGIAAAAIAVAIAIRAKGRSRSAPSQQPPPPVQSAAPTAVDTAAKSTAAPPAAPSPSGAGEEKEEPAEAAEPETISDPKAETDESRAAGE